MCRERIAFKGEETSFTCMVLSNAPPFYCCCLPVLILQFYFPLFLKRCSTPQTRRGGSLNYGLDPREEFADHFTWQCVWFISFLTQIISSFYMWRNYFIPLIPPAPDYNSHSRGRNLELFGTVTSLYLRFTSRVKDPTVQDCSIIAYSSRRGLYRKAR